MRSRSDLRHAAAPAPVVPYVDLGEGWPAERVALMADLEAVFASGMFLGGDAVDALEERLARYCGARHAVTLDSGTDALMLSLKAHGIGPGDEVITPPNSFIASAAAIVHVGATPVFADVRADQNIDPDAVAAAITPRTRAIMPVHLTGRVCDMARLKALADRHGLLIVEDAAQAIGSAYDGVRAGGFGGAGCFSTHPLKNLGGAGDGGFVTTDDPAIAERLRRLRNHGLVDRNTALEWGYVSRMDALQAAVLLRRMDRLDQVIAARRRHAALYRTSIDARQVFMPPCAAAEFNTFHLFVIQTECRDTLQIALKAQGMGSAVHYPIPIHLQPAAASLGYRHGDFPVVEAQADRIVSLPVHQFLDEAAVLAVAGAVNRFFG
jgi:dTDP-4-amino-4,6-dideoxygalactose transaminase